jgi:aryl-alcohol dehydrogenase-like predicted oxidoreductase
VGGLTQTLTLFTAHKQVAINWCISKGTVPIPGARSLKQAEENLGAIGWRLALAEVEALDAAAEKVPRELVQVLKNIHEKTIIFLCKR